jgi:hypothetical protein
MKKLIALIVMLLPFFINAQVVPKNADKIIVQNDNSAEQNFKLAKQLLADNDIEVASQDKDIFQIKTGRIRINNDAGCTYLINCKDDKVTITGSWGTTLGINIGYITSAPSTYQLIYKGTQKSTFNRMNEFAKKLGDNISYTTLSKKVPQKDDVY